VERVLLFRALPRSLSGEVFSYLKRPAQDALLKELADEETRELLAHLKPDDRTALLEELPAEVTRRLMDLLGPEDLEEARTLLGYPEKSVGRLMTPDYVALRPGWTVAEALEHIRKVGYDSETLSRVYVTDDDGKLLDDIRIRQLILAEPEQRVDELMDGSVISISAFADQEEAVRLTERYDLFALPVVASGGVLLGIVTVDDVMDVAEAEATEDTFKRAGVDYADDEVSRSEAVLESPLSTILRLRLPWLMVALVGGLIAATVIGAYEETLEALVALAFFVPLIMDMGGNVGTQASTIFVRGVAVGQVEAGNVIRHLSKEILFGFATGLIVGVLAGAAAFLWQGMLELALVIFLSMTAVCTIASLIGYAIPWLAHRLDYDPAAVSDPFITTVKDATALLIYFALASALMGAFL
jgi:magnesium transporter